MPTQDTLNTVNVSIGESTNNSPIATGTFQRIWNRLLSTLSRQQHDTGEDQVERGEHTDHAKRAIHVGEGNHEENTEAGTTPLNGDEVEATKSQHHSPFSSTAFDQLAQPVPVVDIFFGSWWLVLALRTATRPAVIYISFLWLWTSAFQGVGWMVVLAAYLFRWVLLMTGHDTIPLLGVPIPGKRQLLWVLFRWVQKFWVMLLPALPELVGSLTSIDRSTSQREPC